MNHSGVLGALLAYLTGVEGDAASSSSRERDGEGEGREGQVAACEDRLRLFLHVFADMPLHPELVHARTYYSLFI